MRTINILDESLINKIAAGEVIDRPASVIKELVENSIDAGATNVIVKISNDCFDLIIEDNGCGMSEDDLTICLTKHATSKIKNVDDLFNVNSLGFRGEALASVAAISKLKISTKQENHDSGFELIWNSGTQDIKEIATTNGTKIDIKDLFYNTPVRKNFLKSGSKEYMEILDVITRFSLYYNQINFKLFNNDKLTFQSFKGEPIQSLISVYGKDIAKNMLEIKIDVPFRIEGFISKPPLSRSNKENQTLFVNGRYIKNKLINDAIYQGYHSMLFVGRHPIYMLKIFIDPKTIDVNVHPTKKEIRIQDEEIIFKIIFEAINTALTKDKLTDKVFSNTIQEELIIKPIETNTKNKEFIPTNITESKNNVVEENENPISRIKTFLDYNSFDSSTQQVLEEKTDYISKTYETNLRDYKIFGQFNKCFIIAQKDDNLMVIDQHTAEERIFYDKLMKQYNEQGIKKQALISPIIIDLNPIDAHTVNENIQVLSKLGFDIEPFGTNSFSVRSLAVIFSRQQNKNTVMDIIDELLTSNKSNKLDNLKESMITRMACRAAIKRGDDMTTTQMYELIDKLFSSTLPNTCPHGRPIIIPFSMLEFEKMFKRK